jgi:hypothetical protein
MKAVTITVLLKDAKVGEYYLCHSNVNKWGTGVVFTEGKVYTTVKGYHPVELETNMSSVEGVFLSIATGSQALFTKTCKPETIKRKRK